MRNRARMLFPLTLIAVVAIAGISMAADGGSSSSGSAGARADSTSVADRSDRPREFRRFRHDFGDADVRAVLEDIREAVAKQAPDVAGPIIDKAREDDKITEAQADKLRDAAQALADGKHPDPGDLDLRDADVRDVIHDAFRALARRAPDIADPIIDKAVADDKITEAQADRIREMIERKSEHGEPKFGGRAPGCGGPGGFGPGHGPGVRPGGPPPSRGSSGETSLPPTAPGTPS
jgi:hypothetical protein